MLRIFAPMWFSTVPASVLPGPLPYKTHPWRTTIISNVCTTFSMKNGVDWSFWSLQQPRAASRKIWITKLTSHRISLFHVGDGVVVVEIVAFWWGKEWLWWGRSGCGGEWVVSVGDLAEWGRRWCKWWFWLGSGNGGIGCSGGGEGRIMVVAVEMGF